MATHFQNNQVRHDINSKECSLEIGNLENKAGRNLVFLDFAIICTKIKKCVIFEEIRKNIFYFLNFSRKYQENFI